jgi:Pyruvate/2-oxoacid:ferredoxin oxidoreductase gamma subunit
MDINKEQMIKAIKSTVPEKTIDINIKAFEEGYYI